MLTLAPMPQFDALPLSMADACQALKAYPQAQMFAVKLWLDSGSHSMPHIYVYEAISRPAAEYSTF